MNIPKKFPPKKFLMKTSEQMIPLSRQEKRFIYFLLIFCPASPLGIMKPDIQTLLS